MRKNINTEHIEGRVYQHSLELKESGPNSKNPGTKYISGNLNIAVDEDGMNVITIHFTYVTAVTSKGNKNSTFTTLNKIIDNPENTWITGGKDNAFKVKVDTALALNDFYANDGTLVSAKRNEGGFVSFVNELNAPSLPSKLSILSKAAFVSSTAEISLFFKALLCSVADFFRSSFIISP